MLQTKAAAAVWHPELKTLGYDTPLPPPSAVVQTTIACIPHGEIHEYIQESDRSALNEFNEHGETAPLLLATLDLSQWTSIMFVATADKDKGLSRLAEAHKALAKLLAIDEQELDEAMRNNRAVENALRLANPHEDWGTLPPPADSVFSLEADTCHSHPLLARLNITQEQKATIEGFSECIMATQQEREMASLDSKSKGPGIPFLPPRQVEEMLRDRDHKIWLSSCCNLEAPITAPMWRLWTDLPEAEIKACETRALSCEGLLREPVEMLNAFPLATFDRNKCPNIPLKVHVKNDVATSAPRHAKYCSQLWNSQRPYLRCSCNVNAKTGCTGTMLWFDHAIWFLVNHLDRFFDDKNYPTLASKYGAFLIWIKGTCRTAVRAQLTFKEMRRLMATAALEYAVDPAAKLLTKFYEAPGARKIERLFKPASFSEQFLPSPSAMVHPNSRKRKFGREYTPAHDAERANKTPNVGTNPPQHRSSGGRGHGANPNRPALSRNNLDRAQLNSHDADFLISPPAASKTSSVSIVECTPPNTSVSSRGPRPRIRSPIRGRALNWNDL